jgi:hypothetical protein
MATKSVRFKLGMIVKINSDYTGLKGRLNELVSEYRYKRGEHVRLLSYDSSDETWRVEKVTPGASGYKWLWIKRKNLAPISSTEHVENNPFKVGDKVELIDAQFDWVQSERATTGVVYEVIDASKYDPISQTRPYIKIKGGNAKSEFWIESAAFKKVEKSTSTTNSAWAVGDKFIHRSDTNQVYTIEEYPTDSERIRVTWVNNQDGLGFTSYDKSAVTSNIASGVWKIVKQTKTEIPKTETKRMAVFINNSSECASHFVLGQTYEIISETDAYYYIAGYKGGMYKWRFKELTNKTDTVDDITEIMCIDNLGYAGKLTIGKTYQASRKRNNESAVDSKSFWYIDEDDRGQLCSAYKRRFVVITDKVDNAKPKREWKIGDTLLTSFLNDPNIEKEFYGYNPRWENYRDRDFIDDRKVEEIKKVDGKLAARISSTMNLWISLQSLELHP